MTDSIETRVARGVALLDKTLADWDERVNLRKLDLTMGCCCILGQTWDDENTWLGDEYADHALALFGGDFHDSASGHGFNAVEDDRALRGNEIDELTAEWKRVILARRGGAS